MSSASDAIVRRAVALVDALYLALVLGDASERVEACVGIINDAPDRAM